MTTKHIYAIIAILTAFRTLAYAQENISPDGTYLYCKRDTCDLYMDVYEPSKDSRKAIGTNPKPTVIFMFAGGFADGSREDGQYKTWFRHLNDNGFRVISIDYRLGLKDSGKIGPAQVDILDKAIHLAVEDLFSATNYILDNADELGIDSERLVISGSSAGAVVAMQAEYEICNKMESASVLPMDFRYAGVMSFAGAILSRQGDLKYLDAPAPTLILHGTTDTVVPYNQIKSGKNVFMGGGRIIKKFQKSGYSYNMYHFNNAGHEIAGALMETLDLQLNFLDNNIVQKRPRIIEAWVEDESIK